MKKGFDANRDLTRFAAGLKAAGYDFVGRYYNTNNPSKNLSLAEAHMLTNAGLSIIAVWENGYPTSAVYFSHSKGVSDGTAAYHFANENIGQPAGTPIYFAVDYDASNADALGVISQYFQGVRDAFNTISQNNPVYSIGVYGSGLVCGAILDTHIADFAWLAQSSGWAGSKTFSRYNIKQALQKTECTTIHGGITGDPNTSPNNNEGSFSIVGI